MDRKLELYVHVVDIARSLCLVAEGVADDLRLGSNGVAQLARLRHELETNARQLAMLVRNERV